MTDEVVIVDTGVANTASVVAAFERLGLSARLTVDGALVEDALLVVLPGVGSFGAGMARLEDAGLADVLRDRAAGGRSLLAVCLGMQLLCAASEESPGVGGLGVVDGRLEAFGAGVRRPQFGWNVVSPEFGDVYVERGHAFFANSYRLADGPAGWRVSWSEHGGRFVSAMSRGGVLGCQFHPELSGVWGLRLLERWVRGVREEAAAC